MSVGEQSAEQPFDQDLSELIASYRSLLAGQVNDPDGNVRALALPVFRAAVLEDSS